MHNTLAGTDRNGTMSLARVIRGVAEGSLAVLAFAVAILLIGIPIAVVVRALHDGLGWLAGL